MCLRTIIDVIEWSGSTCNFVYRWAVLCQHVYTLRLSRSKKKRNRHVENKIRHVKRLDEERNLSKSMAKTYAKHFILKDSTVERTRFISNMLMVLS